MDYGRLFTRAWQLCWNNKFLFVLGFLAALGSGLSGGGTNYQFSEGDLQQLPPGFAENFDRFMAVAAPFLIGLACIGLLIGLILWLVRLAAQAGLISAAARLDAGEKVSFGNAFSAGTHYLLRFIGLTLLLYLPLWILGIIAFVGSIGAFGSAFVGLIPGASPDELDFVRTSAGLLGLCAALACCVAAIYGLLVTLVYPFAQRGIVLLNLGVIGSIRHGWRVLTNNIAEIILLILFFIVIGFVFAALLALILIPLGFLSAAPAALGALAGGTFDAVDAIWLLLGVLLIALISAIVNAILVAYRSVTFTLAYAEFVDELKPDLA